MKKLKLLWDKWLNMKNGLSLNSDKVVLIRRSFIICLSMYRGQKMKLKPTDIVIKIVKNARNRKSDPSPRR